MSEKSTSDYIMMYGNGLVTWASRKQEINALSTLESEYLAAASAIQEIKYAAVYLHLLKEAKKIVILRCDNQRIIKYSANTEQHRRTKHIDNKYQFAKDEIENGRVKMEYINRQAACRSINEGAIKRSFY